MASLFPEPCPQLPEFHSLLLKGAYHASAPIHLLLSHTAGNPDARAVLLTPQRASFKDALVNLNDEWLDRKSGHGRVASASRRTQIYYPPTLAHLRLLLSMLHEYDATVHHEKTTLEAAPCLLVLQEISAYFDSRSSETTVSAYLSVIAAALALTDSWSPRCSTRSKLVVFDSGLAALKLPILRPLSFEDNTHDVQRHRDALSVLLERYFEWKADVLVHDNTTGQTEDGAESENDATDSPSVRRSLTLKRCRGEDGASGTVWHWAEVTHNSPDDSLRRPGTVFHWEDLRSSGDMV